MFGRKKKCKPLSVEVFDAQGKRLISCDALDYELPDEIVIALSIEYFNDPEPCEIHRAAVLKRVMMELLDVCGVGNRTAVSALNDTQRRCLPPQAAELWIRGEGV